MKSVRALPCFALLVGPRTVASAYEVPYHGKPLTNFRGELVTLSLSGIWSQPLWGRVNEGMR